MDTHTAIQLLTPAHEAMVHRNPLLNIDTFIIPSPYIRDLEIEKDYGHSYIWLEEGEILGYLLVYSDSEGRNFHIYKLVTSPFVRGRGIGTAFIEYLARNIPEEAVIFLYVWEKQADTMEFFRNKGFRDEEPLVYRNLVYYHMSGTRADVLKFTGDSGKTRYASEEIGRARHDARKTVRLLSSMVDSLSNDNCGRIIEDINRETTSLINILNSFRDSLDSIHEINLKDLIIERIIPYIEASPIRCEFNLNLNTRTSVVMGYYVNIGRALVNLISNSLEAIESADRKGKIGIRISEQENHILFHLEDNGTGIPARLLETDQLGLPAFVGRTTKKRKTGEGLGTIQIFSTFGRDNIKVESTEGEGTRWEIRFEKRPKGLDRWFVRLERRFNEFRTLWEDSPSLRSADRTAVIAYIWQTRKMEIFLFDLIQQFSKYHNMRSIYRTILAFLQGRSNEKRLLASIKEYRSDHEKLKEWLFGICLDIRHRMRTLEDSVSIEEYKGPLFKSYGQAIENVIIFTMNPENGDFLATDRKLAEHLDFAPYLNRETNDLLRGEFIGDTSNHQHPIFLGVWSTESEEDLMDKLKLIRTGAQCLLRMGIHADKKLSLYQTTYPRYDYEIDSDASSTFGRFACLSDEELKNYTRPADNELSYILPNKD